MMLSLQSDARQQQHQAAPPPLPQAFGSVPSSAGVGFSSGLFRIVGEFDDLPPFSLQPADVSVDVKPSMQMVKPVEGLFSFVLVICLNFVLRSCLKIRSLRIWFRFFWSGSCIVDLELMIGVMN